MACLLLRCRAFWSQWRDDIITRDMDWIHRINPNGETLESWMRANNYTGNWSGKVLKNAEDQAVLRLRKEVVSNL